LHLLYICEALNFHLFYRPRSDSVCKDQLQTGHVLCCCVFVVVYFGPH
uniref:Ovule protein n=1 Tax=Brugia timori TaxID=42155 RepID=A0A0R3QZW8_9BILA